MICVICQRRLILAIDFSPCLRYNFVKVKKLNELHLRKSGCGSTPANSSLFFYACVTRENKTHNS